MPTLLLHSKLMAPRLQAAVIPRLRLVNQLEAGASKRLTVVSAPTGFGKTTLVNLWLNGRNSPAAWVALDENDNDPVRFWTYVISALRTLDAEIGKHVLAALATAQLPALQTILTQLVIDLQRLAGWSVLVLEDYQAITAASIHTSLEFLLQHKPDRLHVVIIARREPDLPLGILRARAELSEISAAELRFDLAETKAFLQENLSGQLPDQAPEKLQERTGGWAAGLRLAALLLHNKDAQAAGQAIESFSGGHRFVADYLIREVFFNQPDATQNFLLKTCFLNRLTGGLCDALTGEANGAAILEQLERENLFIIQMEPVFGRTWYSYSPLFAESIQSLARQRLGVEGVQALFQKASDWYTSQKLFDDAIEMALAAGQFERALELIETFVEIYSLRETGTLARWIERIPDAFILANPAVSMVTAQVFLFSSDRYAPATAARIAPYLNAAEQAWAAAGNDARLGTALALRGMVLFWQGELRQSLETVQRALEILPESEIFWRGVSLLNAAAGEIYAGRITHAQDEILEARALLGASQNTHGLLAANGILSEIFFAQGDLELCVQLCQQNIAAAVGDESMLDDQGAARLALARVAYEKNDLETAALHAAEAFDLGKRRANELLQAQAAGQLALIHAARGAAGQARADLKALEAGLHSPLALWEIRACEYSLAVREGLAPGAWLLTGQQALATHQERQTFIQARWEIAGGQPGTGLALIQPALAEAAAQGRIRSQAEALAIKAQAQHAGGQAPAAVESLSQALTIGQAKGFRRLFIDEGSRMAALLKDALPLLNKPAQRFYAGSLLQALSGEVHTATVSGPAFQAPVEPLSQQETRVLKLLAAGLSNGEIAHELVVSTNTVKTHIKNIYRKLNINSREEARAVVRDMRLL